MVTSPERFSPPLYNLSSRMTFSPLPWHALLLVLLVGTHAFFAYLAVRNLRHSRSMLEAERDWLASRLGLDEPKEVFGYTAIKTGFGQLQSWIGLAFLLLVLYAGVFTEIVVYLDATGLHPLIAGVIFFVGFVVALQLFSVPFDLIDTFVVEELYEFNNQTLGLWIRDAILGMAVTVILTVFLVGALLLFVMALPTWWWLATALFFIGFSLVMQVVYPRAIAPIFNDFEPIEDGSLREAVEGVFNRAGFTCDELYLMDASRRSSHVNAYFVGFGRTKRVVLFDTLVEQLEEAEIQSVLAHELAHWKRHHIWKQLGGSTIRVTITLFVLWVLIDTPAIYEMFNIPETAVYAGLFIGLLFVGPLLRWTAPLENRLSLAHEREADRFAVTVLDTEEPMVSALETLASENLSNPFPDPLYATFHYSHPPIPERIRSIREAANAVTG